MLRINDIKIKINDRETTFEKAISKKLKISLKQIGEIIIVKKSLDVRNKRDICWVYSFDFELLEKKDAKTEYEKSLKEELIKKFRLKEVGQAEYEAERYFTKDITEERYRPVVAGFGPAGMFAALTLAEYGLKPLVIERGGTVKERKEKIKKLWSKGILDSECNVQFGEGGAGTFSDGKLNTGTKDKRIKTVIKTMSEYGGGKELLYKQKPHVGTDRLEKIVENIRNRIEALGGEIMFNTRLTDFSKENGELTEITVEKSGERINIPCNIMVLAIGHSARDTFRLIYEKGIEMEQKPFSMGVRIEHSQDMINRSQYGEDFENIYGMSFEEAGMPAAEYKLSYHCADGRGVYTFCMCPGGFVIASASEKGRLVTNGMSFSKRDGKNANSGLLVEIRREDLVKLKGTHPLAGVELQEEYEEAAFKLGGENYFAPAMRVGKFLNSIDDEKQKRNLQETFMKVEPTYRPGVLWTDISQCLPAFVTEALKEALPYMGKKIKGFDHSEAILTAIESRSSSPVRILRDADYESSLKGIYPCGEGPGYAGGITSAAVDGIRIAEKIIETRIRR